MKTYVGFYNQTFSKIHLGINYMTRKIVMFEFKNMLLKIEKKLSWAGFFFS